MSSAGERFRARMAAAAATTALAKGPQQAAVHLRVHSTPASSFSLSASPSTPAAVAAASLASPPPPLPSALDHAAHPAGCCCWSCYTAAASSASSANGAAAADDDETRAKLDLLTDIITIQRWARQMQFVRRMPRRYPATDRVVRESCRKTDATLSHSRLWRERMAAMVAEVDGRIRGNGDGGGGGGGGGGSDTRRGEGEGKSGGPARRGGGGDTQAKDDAYESMRLENEFLRLQIGALVLMCCLFVCWFVGLLV
jgi:hypothetical protein